MTRFPITVDRLRGYLLFALGIVYLVNLFVGSAVLADVALVLLIVVTGLSLAAVTGSTRVISYAAFLISIGLLLAYRAPLRVWADAFEENLYMVVMFAMIPLLSIPIRHGGYFEALRRVFDRFVHTRNRFYLFVSLVAAFIGSIVNLAVVPLVHEVAKASPLSADKKLLSAAMTRGFTTCTIWAPTTAAIALIMQLTGSEWQDFFPFGITSGIVVGFVGYGISMLESRRDARAAREAMPGGATPAAHASAAASPEPASAPATAAARGGPGVHGGAGAAAADRERHSGGYGKFLELCGFGLVLIASIALISYLSGLHTIAIVSLAALIFPFLWMGLLRRIPVLLREARDTYFGLSLPSLRSEVTLFVGAGVFTTSITYSHLGEHVAGALSQAVGGSIVLLTVAIIAVGMGLGALGVHPIITVAVFGGTVKAAAFGVSPIYMAVVLAAVWALGLSVSPSSATIIAVSGLTRQSPVRVGTRWNGVYAVVAAAALIGVLTLLRLVGAL